MSAHRRSNLRCGVGVSDTLDKDAEVDRFAGRAGPLVIFCECSRTGTLTGKHFDGNGLEEDHNGVDQGALWDPTDASMPKSTSILTSLSTLMPVFEVPALSPQTPRSSMPTRSAQCLDMGWDDIPNTALSVTLASGKLTVTATSTFPICCKSNPNFISGFEVALKVTEADALLRLNLGVNWVESKPVAELAPWSM